MDNTTFSILMSDRNPTYYMKNLGLHSREIEFNQKKYLIWSTLWDKLSIIAKKKKCNVYLAYLVIVNISGSHRLEATVFCGKGQIQWEKQSSCLTWKLHRLILFPFLVVFRLRLKGSFCSIARLFCTSAEATDEAIHISLFVGAIAAVSLFAVTSRGFEHFIWPHWVCEWHWL